MKNNTIVSASLVLAIIACTIFMSDGFTYLIASLMALVVIGIIHYNRQRLMKITRWAKANAGKAQVFITALQIALIALGIFAGYNLKKLGYEFSNVTAYVFSTVIVISFLWIPFLPKRSTIAIPKVVHRHRLAYIGITLSSFVMMAVFGNRLERDYPAFQLTHTVRAIDDAIFQGNSTIANLYDEVSEAADDPNYGLTLADGSPNIAVYAAYTIYGKETIAPSTLSKKEIREKLKAEKKLKRFEKKRQKMINLIVEKRLALAAGLGVGAILLLVLLAMTTCAGICLMIGGFAGGGVGYGLLGIVVAAASIFGMVKIGNGSTGKPKTKP